MFVDNKRKLQKRLREITTEKKLINIVMAYENRKLEAALEFCCFYTNLKAAIGLQY